MKRPSVLLAAGAVLAAWYALCFGRVYGRTLLIQAAAARNPLLVKGLLALGANPNVETLSGPMDGFTPLAFAAQNGDSYSVAALLRAGADPNFGGTMHPQALPRRGPPWPPEARQALCRATMVASPMDLDIMTILIDAGARIDSPDAAFFALNCLHDREGRAGKARFLIDRGASITAVSPRGYPIVVEAAEMGYSDVVEVLLQAGVDVNTRAPNGWTPLIAAAAQGDPVTVSLLLAHGADVTAKGADGETALDLARHARRTTSRVVQYEQVEILLSPDVEWR